MTGKKREAISSSESFEQANLSDMSRQTQRARTKSAFRSDLRTASPTPSLWSSSDISDGGAVPVQVVVNKSGAELAVERHKAHGSMIMATIATVGMPSLPMYAETRAAGTRSHGT